MTKITVVIIEVTKPTIIAFSKQNLVKAEPHINMITKMKTEIKFKLN